MQTLAAIASDAPPSNRTADAVDHHVAAEIRRHRIAAQLSQAELARRLGVTWQQVQKYENADNRVSAGRLYDITRALGLDLVDLFPESGEAECLDARVRPPRASPQAERLAAAFDAISNSKIRAQFFALITAYSDYAMQRPKSADGAKNPPAEARNPGGR